MTFIEGYTICDKCGIKIIDRGSGCWMVKDIRVDFCFKCNKMLDKIIQEWLTK